MSTPPPNLPPPANDPEVILMRPDESLDAKPVGAFLEGKLPGAQGTPEMRQFGGGHANLTYLVRYQQGKQAWEYVLRRPPLGPVAPKSHDMGREYEVLSRLYKAFPLAPQAFLFSDDASVVGAPFLVMERRQGQVIRTQMPPGFTDNPALNRRISEMLVDTLAALHNVDIEAVELGHLGKPDGFVQRQLVGWQGRWERAKTSEEASVNTLLQWLEAHLPASAKATLLHNDFKLDNVMVTHEDPAQPVAVFDWDMATLGDPLMDLGALLGYWSEMADDEVRKAFAPMPTAQEGFLTRAQVVERYAQKTGLDVSQMAFYEAFALFKIAVIIQQIYFRYHNGQTKDERFASYGQKALLVIQAALEATTKA